MADRDRDAALAQALDDIAVGDVRALHLVAEDVHHLGDAGHADAADADEMDGADVGATPSCRARLAGPSGWSSGAGRSRTDRSGAAADPLDQVGERARRVGLPSARARAAALTSASGSSASFCICLASSTGVNCPARSSGRRPPGPCRGHWRSGDRRSPTAGDQDGRASGRGQLGDGRGAGAADHQMRPGQRSGMSVI